VVKMDPELRGRIRQLPTSLPQALEALETDHQFLLEGGVFPADLIEAWIRIKQEECVAVNLRPHPQEYMLYYDL